ncbi:hypothetical protein DY000_02053062 [Brassica cretica]|uniref:Uncharacterized protein n=2 Tax=Brassica cretica TaxID=69181 RepID=A0ABQ7A873_BRACR|nr:hypothetical protein DY000_02053062 [Brassica cretica]
MYARFTEEWSVGLARGSCREEEHISIDAELLTSIDMDARMRLGKKGGTPSESSWNSIGTYILVPGTTMKRGFLGPSKKEPADSRKIRTYILVPGTTMKRGFLGPSKKEPADSRKIRIVHLDTIHPPSIDTVHHPLIDTVNPASIDTVNPASIDTVNPASIDSVHPVSIDFTDISVFMSLIKMFSKEFY